MMASILAASCSVLPRDGRRTALSSAPSSLQSRQIYQPRVAPHNVRVQAAVEAEFFSVPTTGELLKLDLEERVVEVRRVTKVVKGGKQMSFRAVVVVGDGNGKVGVGCDSAKEVMDAVRKASLDARRHLTPIILNKVKSFPHATVGRFGGAKVMLRPAADGAGVIAGGSVRVVMEVAGVKNGFGKQLGSPNALNNAKATIEGLSSMRTMKQVAEARDVSLAYLYGETLEAEATA